MYESVINLLILLYSITVLCHGAEDLYLILVNIRVCSYDDSLLYTSLRRSAFHYLVEGRKIKTVKQIK